VQAGSSAGLSNIADVVMGPVPQVSATGVPVGTYYVRVSAIDATGTSAPSNEGVVVVARPSPPAAPTGLTAQVSGSAVTLVWTARPVR
jgi:hypothetical protein